jgi:hypothetical protein
MALGAILLSQGLVTNEQLEQAAREQARGGERLEQTIARLGFASTEQVMRALADELAMPFVRLDETEFDEEAVRAVPPRLVFKLRAIPIRFKSPQPPPGRGKRARAARMGGPRTRRRSWRSCGSLSARSWAGSGATSCSA